MLACLTCTKYYVVPIQWWPGVASGKDFAADLLGSLVATIALVLWEQRSQKELHRYIDLELGVVVSSLYIWDVLGLE